jgi:hypothetical protein
MGSTSSRPDRKVGRRVNAIYSPCDKPGRVILYGGDAVVRQADSERTVRSQVELTLFPEADLSARLEGPLTELGELAFAQIIGDRFYRGAHELFRGADQPPV